MAGLYKVTELAQILNKSWESYEQVISPGAILNVFEDLGWITAEYDKPHTEGRHATALGVEQGAKEVSFPKFPLEILHNLEFVKKLQEKEIDYKVDDIPNVLKSFASKTTKYPTNYFEANDGDIVKSPYELAVDNFLYRKKIKHSYEKTIRIEYEIIKPDFCILIPIGKKVGQLLYIEVSGENGKDIKHNKRNEKKRLLYEKYNYNVIYISLDDVKEKFAEKLCSKFRSLDLCINIQMKIII